MPAEVTRLRRDGARHALLHNVQLRPAGYFVECYRRLHLSGQIRVIEFVRVTDAFVRCQFKIFSAEGMAFTRSEIGERHLVGAADLCIHLVNLSRESIWRKPFRHRIWIKECAIYFIRRGTEHAVKPNRVCSAW